MHIAVTTITTVALCRAIVASPLLQLERTSQSLATAISLSKHSSLLGDDRTVNFGELDSHVASLRDKIVHGLDNYEKNTGMVHPAAIKGNMARTLRSDAIALTSHKTVWYGTISVGNPRQSFTVAFDTGSADFVLPGDKCDETCEGHTHWDLSKGAKPAGQPFRLEYGDGSTILGVPYTDNVTISGFTADSQVIGAATKYPSKLNLRKFPADGVMGMGFSSLSRYRASSVFETLVMEGKVLNSVFSFNLTATGGELYIGGSNPSLYKNGFFYTDVTKVGYWQVKIQSILGDKEELLSDIDAIIDTGSSLIGGDPTRVAALYEKLGGKRYKESQYYTLPCDSFPTISFTFGGKSWPISPSAINLGPVSTGHKDCFSGLVSIDLGASFWVVGAPFLQSVYTVFDFGKIRVGFAELA